MGKVVEGCEGNKTLALGPQRLQIFQIMSPDLPVWIHLGVSHIEASSQHFFLLNIQLCRSTAISGNLRVSQHSRLYAKIGILLQHSVEGKIRENLHKTEMA